MIAVKKKYIYIYDSIAEKVKNGLYQPGELLPSENQLVKEYSTSRETIRKALKLLSEHGYIQKIQGKGSVVLDINKVTFPVSGLVSFKELAQKMEGRVSTDVTTFQEITPDEEVKSQLSITAEEMVWKVGRVRKIDGEKIIYDKDYLLKDIVPALTKEICADSIYHYVESVLGLIISFAKKEITIEKPSSEDKELLDLNEFSSIVVVKNHVYLDDTTLFQYTESRHRPDKFKFVDFARRNH
ncbi:GntR family transcriptional regulator, trehalose operon transcriptional repressor [Alteribacillus bidgolensis]|uniref:Trehalose operon repressor n=1 Tax=Alteribacillus bidgolensis TaxID=930129 RepID=A0A1G8L763_9BACI|nr:GntR family transcriptional regulator, trehalose operon transcriptional repressor [Alteribacillus bidgolensis]